MAEFAAARPSDPAADLARQGFSLFPSLIDTAQASNLHDATLVYPPRRVICGDKRISFTERMLDTSCELVLFFSSDPILQLLSRCTGREPSEVNAIRAWTSCYSVGEFINAHRDKGGDIQIILGLRAADADNGGILHLSYQGNEAAVFLTPGDLVVFRATEVDHWTTPLSPTSKNPLPERVVGVARYFYNPKESS